MPFARSTLSELRALAAADLAAALPGSDPLLGVSNLAILADVLAEGVHAALAYLDFIARQSVPFTAVDEALEAWGALKGVVRKPATEAAATVTFVASVGAVIPAGTPVSRSDGGSYTTVADAIAGGGGTVAAQIVAEDAGSVATLAAGANVVLGVAVAGVASTGVVSAPIAGVDVEATEAFRTRILQVFANPPQGGAKSDYVEWTLEVPGVTRAWCTPLGAGPGTVYVYFMMDVVHGPGGFPVGTNGVASEETRDMAATGDQLVVADHIFPLRPVTALVYSLAPGQNTVTFTINLDDASVALQALVEDAIDAVFLAYGMPGGVVFNSTIESAIAAITGTAGFVITAEACNHGAVTPGSAGNIQSNAGFLPVKGVVTWVT